MLSGLRSRGRGSGLQDQILALVVLRSFVGLWRGLVGVEFLFGEIVRSYYCCLGYGTSYDTWGRGCSLLHRVVGLVVTWYN